MHLRVLITLPCRKAQASVLAVDERQSLETLARDEKTSSRVLTQLKERYEGLTSKLSKLEEDEASQKEKRKEVFIFCAL